MATDSTHIHIHTTKTVFPKLTRAIFCCNLLAELSDSEFNTFWTNLNKKCGASTLSTFLFNSFIQKPNYSITNTLLETATDVLNSIIRSISLSQMTTPLNRTIDIVFPSEVIANVSSWLTFPEMNSFMTTNRNIYIACNNPNQLQYLDIRKIPNYSSIPIAQYPFLKKLSIRLQDFQNFPCCTKKGDCIFKATERINIGCKR